MLHFFNSKVLTHSAFIFICVTWHNTSAASSADARFGLVGAGGAAFAAKFGLTYYTLEGNYSAETGSLFSSVHPAYDPAAGFSVVREVAKLNVRNDSLGETNAQFQSKLSQYTKDLASWYVLPSWGRGKKPVFKWYTPNAVALIHAESLQIVETIRREKARNPAITGTVWEIGNEPNLFPAILPVEYAAIFTQYQRVIKAEDPGAVVAMGAIFLPETSQDLKARFGEELEAKIKTELQAANLYTTLVSLGVFSSLVTDVKNTVLSRTLSLSSREYLQQVLDACAARPEIVTLHVYPYDDRAPFLDSAALRSIVDTTVNGIAALLAATGIPSNSGGSASIWVTEFGNIEQGLDADQAAERMLRLVDCFQTSAAIGRWFHYKSIGVDEQFALFSSGPAPLTRLATESGFAPADGKFACTALNALGRAYWRASHGGSECQDPQVVTNPVTDSVKVDSVVVTDSLPHKPVVVGPAQPMILNSEGSQLSTLIPLRWDVASGLEMSTNSAGTWSVAEFFRDSSASELLLRRDSLKTQSYLATLPGGSATIWVRVKFLDSHGLESPWSAFKKLVWAGAPVTRLLAGPVVGFSLKSAGGGRSIVIMRIELSKAASVRVQILDARGQTRRTLFQGRLEAGSHAFPYDGRGGRGRHIETGVYFCRFQADGEVRTIPTQIPP